MESNKLEMNFDESIIIRNLMKTNEYYKVFNDISLSIIHALKYKKRIFTCGNGGSATDAMHFTGELLGRYKDERVSLPGICLNSDISAMTAIANDYGYDQVFSRQIEGLGNEGDILFILSTSGNSINLINAAISAREKKIKTIALLGKGGGEISKNVDFCIIVPSFVTARIQEIHITIIHSICELIDESYSN
jgi:D-sedoheptulose 7-phosphate isomerase